MGFFLFFLVEQLFLLRGRREGKPSVGLVGAAGLSAHSVTLVGLLSRIVR